MTVSQSINEAPTSVSAILLIFGSGFLFACLDTSAKFLVLSGMQAPFVAWTRFAVHTALALILLQVWRYPAAFRANNWPAQMLRGALLAGSTIFNFFALRTLQLAETMSIFFFAPMVITAIAGPLLGERVGWRRWLAVLIGLVGVFVITRPGFGAFKFGMVFSFCALFSYVGYVVMTRKLGSTESAESLIFISAAAPAVLMAPAVPLYGSLPPSLLHWAVLLCLGLFGGIGHWLLIKAYQRASASALAPYPYLQLVWMIISGYVFFHQLPDGWTIAGALIIVASGLYIVDRERKLRLAQRSAPNIEAAPLAKKL